MAESSTPGRRAKRFVSVEQKFETRLKKGCGPVDPGRVSGSHRVHVDVGDLPPRAEKRVERLPERFRPRCQVVQHDGVGSPEAHILLSLGALPLGNRDVRAA